MLTEADLDARIVADMIANARPKRKLDEKPAEFAMRIKRHRQTVANRQRKGERADVIERYTSGEWLLLERELADLTLHTGCAFLAWLERAAWLIEAHIDLRTLAYYTICRRADKLKAAAGISTLDDALGDRPTLAMRARDILRLR